VGDGDGGVVGQQPNFPEPNYGKTWG